MGEILKLFMDRRRRALELEGVEFERMREKFGDEEEFRRYEVAREKLRAVEELLTRFFERRLEWEDQS